MKTKRASSIKRNIAKGGNIITMYSNIDLDTTTSTTADQEVESGAITVVIAEKVMPGVENESKRHNCNKVRNQKLICENQMKMLIGDVFE